ALGTLISRARDAALELRQKLPWLIDHEADLIDVPRKGVGEPCPPGSVEFQNTIRRIDEGAVEVVLALRIYGVEPLALQDLDGLVRYEQGVHDPVSNMDPAFIEDDRQSIHRTQQTDHPDHTVELESRERPRRRRMQSGQEQMHTHHLEA